VNENMGHEVEKNALIENADAMLTRRGLFEFAGLTLATAALQPLAGLAKPSSGQKSAGQEARRV